jgi:hypothetical protein
MNDPDKFAEQKLRQLSFLVYLIPLIGCFPALWSIYTKRGDREEQKICRLSVSLGGIWAIAYVFLWIGSAQTSELLSLRCLYTNSLITSSYFLLCLTLGIILISNLWRVKFSQLTIVSWLAKAVRLENLSQSNK